MEWSTSSIWTINGGLSGTTSLDKGGPGTNGCEGLLHISQSFRIGASPSDCFVSYQEHSLKEFYPFAELQSAYSTAQADWAAYVCKSIYAYVCEYARVYIYIYIYIFFSYIYIYYINGVMVIVIGNGHGDKSSNPTLGGLHITYSWARHESNYSPSRYG